MYEHESNRGAHRSSPTSASIAGNLTAATATIGGVSIGSDGKISNLTSGTIAADNNEAVTGGEVAKYLADNYSTTTGSGFKVTDGTTAASTIAPGGTLTFAAGTNATVSQENGTVTYGISSTPTFTSVTAETLTTGASTLTDTGLTTTGTVVAGTSDTGATLSSTGLSIASGGSTANSLTTSGLTASAATINGTLSATQVNVGDIKIGGTGNTISGFTSLSFPSA